MEGRNCSTASLQVGSVGRGWDDSLLMSNVSEKERDGVGAWRWMFLAPHLQLSPHAGIIDKLPNQIPLTGRERRDTLTTSRHYPVMGLSVEWDTRPLPKRGLSFSQPWGQLRRLALSVVSPNDTICLREAILFLSGMGCLSSLELVRHGVLNL